MKGENYTGFSTEKNQHNRRITPQNKQRKAREMGPPCKSDLCEKRINRHCNSFSLVDRMTLFDNFWKNMTWDEKRAYVTSLVDKREASHRKTNTEVFTKNESFVYYLKLDGMKQQVCKNMFLSTLGIGRSHLRGWLTKPKVIRPAREPNKNNGGDVSFAIKYLEDLPKLPSHYCRLSSSKLYLEPIIRSKSQLNKLYKEKCEEGGIQAVSPRKFSKLFDDQNLSIHHPKKDRCDTCCSFEAGNLGDQDYKTHIKNKEDARTEKRIDKAQAQEGKCHVITMDVQSVLLSPVLNASALYYKTKLAVHNFTIYDLHSRFAKCFLWDETQADLVASVFATCLVAFLEERFTDRLPVIIFSDGCTNQNRNAVLSSALSHYAVKHGKTVVQKYLEKGHTQMEVDSVHANIEKSLKNRSIYSPFDYIEICRMARLQPEKYDVQYLSHQYFLDYSGAGKMRYQSIRPGLKTGDPHVTDIRQLKYTPEGIIAYKLQHNEEWKNLPRNPKVLKTPEFPALYKSKLPLTKRKYQDLMDLLHVLPEKYHQFYVSLPFKK